MIRQVLAVMLLLFSFNATALDSRSIQSAGFDNLTDSEKAEMIKLVADKAATRVPGAISSASNAADTAEKWVALGGKIGAGLAGAAKELGVAANDFAKTPLGTWVVFLITWHIMGAALVHVFFGVGMFLLVQLSLLIYWRSQRTLEVRYDESKTNFFGNYPIKSKTYKERDSAVEGAFLVGTILNVLVSLIVIFTY